MIGPEHAINLSYVLHEPSGSPAVSAAMRRVDKRAVELCKAVSRFGTLDSESLRERVVVHPSLQKSFSENGAPQVVYQARIGAWRLTPALLDLCLSGATPDFVQIDSPGNDSRSIQRHLFRAPAQLSALGYHLPAGTVVGFVVPVVRPGNRSIMLCGEVLASPPHPLGLREIPDAILRLAEEHIRANVFQWMPAGALWNRPAELTLPEFAQPAPPQGR